MTRARELARLGNTNVISVGGTTSSFVGVGSDSPRSQLDVGTGTLLVGAAITLGASSGVISATTYHGDADGLRTLGTGVTVTAAGVVSATSYYGDGSNLDGVASAGLGTALNSDSTDGLAVVYYTNESLNITDDVTIQPPTTTNTAYTQYSEVVVSDSKDLIVADGDEFIPDILGLSTAGVTAMSGSGGRIRVGSITNKAGTGAPDLVNGIVVSGISTFTDSLKGAVGDNAVIVGAGLSVVGISTFAGQLKATKVTAGAGVTVTSDFIHLTDNSKIQLGIASDLAIYHDGSNSYISNGTGDIRIDPKSGERGITVAADGAVNLYHDNTAKIETISAGASVYGGLRLQSGLMRERVKITAGKLSGNSVINIDNGMMHYFTTQETTTTKPNIISSAGINTDMAIGDTMCLTIVTTAAAGGYSFDWRVDGVEASAGVTSSWVGGSAPSAGGSSGLDTYSLTFIKTASARYTMIGNLVNSA